MIDADELRFKQVVLNLLSNAVKFTPDGGSVTVRAHREATDLVVTVTDTGIGVPPEDQERIFESFQQGRPGTGQGRGHRARADPVATHRRAVRGPDVAGKHPGCGKHVRLRDPGLSPRPVDESARTGHGEGPGHRARRRRPGVAGSDVGLPRRLTGAGDQGDRRRAGARADPHGCGLPRSCSTSSCRVSTAGRCWPRLKADPATAAIPVVIASVVDDRPRAHGTWCRRIPAQAGQPRRPCRRAAPRRRPRRAGRSS